MKIHPVGAELFHADGLTDMMKLIAAFRNFADQPDKKKMFGQVGNRKVRESYDLFFFCRPGGGECATLQTDLDGLNFGASRSHTIRHTHTQPVGVL